MPRRCIAFFRPGPNWVPGKSIFEQPLDPHVDYLRRLYAEGHVLMAGPLVDGEFGVTIMSVADEQSARRMVAEDPCVRDGIITAEIRAWKPLDLSTPPNR